jgi:hypothetical protein
MASFPNSIFSPATRSAGQVIASAHMNDVQGELVAIEDGLRNGTAPLNSSNSTFNTVTVSSLFSAPAQPRCAVVSTASSTFTSTAYVGFNFTSQDYNIGGMHSTASNSSAVTIASSGTYFLNARAQKSAGGSTTGVVTITVNGASVATQFLPNSFAAAIALTHVARLQVNDSVSLAVLMSDTSGTQFGGGAAGTDARLEVVRLY